MRMELNVETMDQGGLLPPRAQLEAAFAARDPAYDGLFFVAVRTTGIFCRPSCPSQPHPAHVEFLASARECMQAGYRPCLRCHPLEAGGREPGWVTHLRERVDREPDRPVRAVELQTLGVSPERARRWFQERYGMTFTAWCRQRRLARVLGGLRSGESVDEAVFAAGYESHSGFREAFEAAFGVPPGAGARLPDAVRVECWETPIGGVMAGATDQGLCLLAYLDRERSRLTPAGLGKDLGRPVVAGAHPHLARARAEVDEYFAGNRREFSVPLDPLGTQFQRRVWQELRNIPFAATLSYEGLARNLGQPTACRAVAQANGRNRISIVIPCHRVVGKDGTLTGYGGGLWRKRLLLELERCGRLPR